MDVGSAQPVTEMNTRNPAECEGRPARKMDSLIAICEPIVWKMWDLHKTWFMYHVV
jgi:hypothetical protein